MQPATASSKTDSSPEPTDDALSSVFDAVLARVLAPDFKLPMLPAVASQALAVASDPDISFQRIAKVLQEDPVIAARVMAVANSPLYSMGTNVTTLRTAMMRLGAGNLRDILYQAVAEAHVFRGRPNTLLQTQQRHGVGVGHLCRLVCNTMGIDAEYAFLCGLFHDLGRPLLWQLLDSDKTVGEIARRYERQVPRQLMMDALHTELGARIAGAWDLPELVVEAVRYHHAPRESTHRIRIAKAVAVAEKLAYHFGIGDHQTTCNFADDPECQSLDLSAQEWADLLDLAQKVATSL